MEKLLNRETITFKWVELNDETFKYIERKGSEYSINVLAMNDKGGILVGRISKIEGYGYDLHGYLGGGLFNVKKYVLLKNLI
tara:strand:- start:77396 stop:77641 length:246 start_codon:yes stop_codon:yes gene_type:complete